MNQVRDLPISHGRKEQPSPSRNLLRLNRVLRYGVALVLVVFAILPALWVVSSSLNPAKSLVGGSFFPKEASFINYTELVTNDFFPYGRWFLNSLKIA